MFGNVFDYDKNDGMKTLYSLEWLDKVAFCD